MRDHSVDPALAAMIRKVLLIRRVEERIIKLYPFDKVQSPVHLSIGQEPVAVGVCHPLATHDLLFSTYRGHAFYIAKGGALGPFFAELYGKIDGISKGKAGSMHLSAPDVGLMGSSAIVASTIPHAVGAALAARIRRTGQVIVTVFGDGATEEGVYHESLNLAAVHALPVLFICEDNGLAVHAQRAERQSFDIAEHARIYGIAGETLEDGNDLATVARTTARLVEEMRAIPSPRYLWVHTSRWREHVGPGEDFESGYRDRAAIHPWLESDPLALYPAIVEAEEASVAREIEEAIAFAEASSAPGISELLTDVG